MTVTATSWPDLPKRNLNESRKDDPASEFQPRSSFAHVVQCTVDLHAVIEGHDIAFCAAAARGASKFSHRFPSRQGMTPSGPLEISGPGYEASLDEIETYLTRAQKAEHIRASRCDEVVPSPLNIE
jgi:hypothetical protein